MGEGTGAPLQELPEKASESLDKIEKNLDTILTLTKRQVSCFIALCFAAGRCGWVMGHEGSEKAARSARLEGQEAGVKFDPDRGSSSSRGSGVRV
jgi:hypothetical protein